VNDASKTKRLWAKPSIKFLGTITEVTKMPAGGNGNGNGNDDNKGNAFGKDKST
jgi:hypothetical protein